MIVAFDVASCFWEDVKCRRCRRRGVLPVRRVVYVLLCQGRYRHTITRTCFSQQPVIDSPSEHLPT